MVCERCGEHFEPGDGVCVHCSQSAPAISGGCVYCREAEPVLCEGYCVHCGREVLSGRAGSAGSATSTASTCWAELQTASEDSQLCHESGIESKLTYGERLSVAWLLIWRCSLSAAAISFITGLLVAISTSSGRAAIEILGVPLSLLTTLLLGVFVVMPWLVRSMVKKRFRGFYFVVLHGQEGGHQSETTRSA